MEISEAGSSMVLGEGLFLSTVAVIPLVEERTGGVRGVILTTTLITVEN